MFASSVHTSTSTTKKLESEEVEEKKWLLEREEKDFFSFYRAKRVLLERIG